MDGLDLERFELHERLGEGADMQVFAAIDAETGHDVVLKRPHPVLVERSQHAEVEKKIARLIKIRQDAGDSMPHLAKIIGYTSEQTHDGYFGDSLTNAYTVTVEERARGLPLVGSAVDGVKGFPIGLPQNLFALHTLVRDPSSGSSHVAMKVLDVVETFHDIGYVALDLRPQNVFLDPKTSDVTLIDIGNVTVERPATRRAPPLDMHDVYMELLLWYMTPFDPPADMAAYHAPYGMDSVPIFAQTVNAMIEAYSSARHTATREAGLEILEKLKSRAYTDTNLFRRDFEAILSVSQDKCDAFSESAEHIEAWRRAKDELKEPFWSKFLFDASADLTPYEAR